ncbi:MAG: M56 family metallopeptidase [Planctomycetota bacterium]|jgi:beta-lactamase regulating signal transducer with metallopeptidase domain
MIDLLLQFGLSNLCFSLALAIVALVFQSVIKRPFIAHLLWLLVIVKLVTPPIMTIPLIAIPGPTPITAEALMENLGPGLTSPTFVATALESGKQEGASLSAVTGSSAMDQIKTGLALIWLLGCAGLLTWSLVRIIRFHRLLGMVTEVGPPKLQQAASRMAEHLGMKKVPTIYTTSAHLSPLVWWLGGKVRILIPAALSGRMEAKQLRWVLAHELAHVRRRDHLVRWIEWLACICFWWNPVAWWARRHLRANEEVCCDALVLSSLKPDPRTYANSLLTIVEYIASPLVQPPVLASGINSGRFLERRFRMIVSNTLNRPKSGWVQAWILLCAVIILPLGVAYADSSDEELDPVVQVLRDAVDTGDMSSEQAQMIYAKVVLPLKVEPGVLVRVETMDAIVEAGEISAEDAAIRKEQTLSYSLTMNFSIDVLGMSREEAEIEALVKIDQLTPEEAEKKKAALKMRKRINRADYAHAEAEMQKMVDEGRIPKEAMTKRLHRMRLMMAEDRGERKERDWGAIKRRIEGAVKAGKMTREEADRAYEGIKKRMEMRKDDGCEKKECDDHGEHRKIDWDAIKQRIEGAVEAGKMTREEADKIYIGIKKRMAMRKGDIGERKEIDWDAVQQKIEKAVENGELTREEADMKYESIKKSMKSPEY